MKFLGLIFVPVVLAQVYVGFPFDEQLPTVARVDEPYQFTMANITYRSSVGDLAYETGSLPAWLAFDAASRTFTGTPSSADVGEFQISLTGRDSEGSITNNYTMVVSNATNLRLAAANAMFVEIAKYGPTNGVDGLVVKEGDQIDLSFDKATFTKGANDIIAYYGRSADRSSLPNWIRFDSDSLSFRGTVPHVISENAPSFAYGFSFIASDYYGYAGAEGLFKIVVGGHQLATNVNETIKVNGTLGSQFDMTVPVLSTVYLDSVPIKKENISSVAAEDLPSYIDFNSDSFQLAGAFPNETTFDNFTVVVNDIYGNKVAIPYSFDAIGSVFTITNLPEVNATRGEYFEYQLMPSFFTDNNTEVDASVNGWLSFNKENRTFLGEVPEDFDQLTVNVTASSDFDDETKGFSIKGVDPEDMSSASSASSSSTSSSSGSSSANSSTETAASASASSEDTSKSSGVDRKKLAIGLGVGIPAFILVIALILLLFCCVRRKKKDEEADPSSPGDTTLETDDPIDGPGFGTKVPKDATPKQMASLNMLKLDEKNGAFDDAASTSSSVTHVESTDESHYFDANDAEVPVKSWRANNTTDVAKYNTTGLPVANVRASDASLSTVNTEQLFSVRLVDDNSYIRNSNPSFASNQFLSNNSLSGLIHSDSGNIQRLDSDGNIVESARSPSQSPRKISRSPSSNLAPLVEHSMENSRDYSGSFHSTHLPESGTEGSMNLLARLDVGEINLEKSNSLYDDLKSAERSTNDIDWVEGARRPSNPSRISNASIGDQAKLVDFTRRSSLRESARKADTLEGQSAQIQEHDSE